MSGAAVTERISGALRAQVVGKVRAVRGLTVMVEDLPLPIGALVQIGERTQGEVVAVSGDECVVMVMGTLEGVRCGDYVVGVELSPRAGVGPQLLGRVIDGVGRPIDSLGTIFATARVPLSPTPLGALERKRVSEQLVTGIRAIDIMTPLGKGQRLGIFAGPGVGKSTLMGNIARHAASDVNVIALIGERGREVKDFIEHSLGPQGLARSIVVVATGDEPPLLRIRAARLACSIAEWYRASGADVLLMMDSVTRFAHAQRQVGLSAGEPPTTKGYTPSVFSALGILLERAGSLERNITSGKGGSITGLYTVLVDGDDMTEPIADAARGILDGHIVLSRKLAQRGHYPAIDVLDSVSRVANDITDARCGQMRRSLQRTLALYRDVEDLIQIGAYAKGAKPESDIAVEFIDRIQGLLRQSNDDLPGVKGYEPALAAAVALFQEITKRLQAKQGK